ncbi:DUF421 domain-containing protein [Paenibacillus filicis]|uniref:DUF421 domain-containing protein n=1 Tax=Paenibacillus gyeongsangnamensis TaxID=3388067 RepID=A0ABT4QI35_9BACL|nr:YetF domain-containing protein [Paenibacillus filicis]MCZ8516540.1 DUF421 domain-containing protein [Paenibacillus filicis]
MDYLWKSALLVVSAVVLLRLAGRKSLSQTTIASTVIMFSLGEILVQPIVSTEIGATLLSVSAFLGTLVLLEYLQLKGNVLERWLSGQAVTVIENGKLLPDQLRRTKLTVDNLEMRLRTKGIVRLSDVKTATLEINGELGYELIESAQPVTAGQLQKLLDAWAAGKPLVVPAAEDSGLFKEVEEGAHNAAPPSSLN